MCKDICDPFQLIGTHFTAISILKQPLQPSMTKRLYHQNTVSRTGTGANEC